MDTAVPTSADNVTTFGRAARLITPYFIIRMANDTLVDKWSDVEIVCAKTTQLNKGSSLPPKDSSGYAIRASMVGVLGLVAVMGWLL